MLKKVWLVAFIVLLIDQLSKFYIKTNFELHESVEVFKGFQLAFVENPGMAYGVEFGGLFGKHLLTILRIGLIGFIIWFVIKWARKKASNFFLIPVALILAGAIGNVIDSLFYGIIFDRGTVYNDQLMSWVGYNGLAKANFNGYSSFMLGCVVDMLYFPLFEFDWPTWVPIVGGTHYKFFQPVFNIADSAIFIGIASLLLFRKKAFVTKTGEHIHF